MELVNRELNIFSKALAGDLNANYIQLNYESNNRFQSYLAMDMLKDYCVSKAILN